MNKAELIDAVATSTGLGKSDAASAVESVFSTITTTLQRGGASPLQGEGRRFEPRSTHQGLR